MTISDRSIPAANSTLDPSKSFDDGRVILGRRPATESTPSAPEQTPLCLHANELLPQHGQSGAQAMLSGTHLVAYSCHFSPGTIPEEVVTQDYDLIGYALAGHAECCVGGDILDLKPGDVWMVPAGSQCQYRVLEEFSAVQVTGALARAPGLG